MKTAELRQRFLDYFEERGHALVPSAPVIPHEDPTLLFVNAGMNQFKDVFLGKVQRDYSRAVSSQRCIRVGGKHNDLENVGHTSRHMTFFEMLGNFSFGDYFKEEAIAWAWEFSTQLLDEKRIWVSVFREDDEAFELWKKFLPEKRIVRLDERDNFWTMGETGPCGPCSELLYDRGERFGSAESPYEDTGGERFFEFWNLVFMEFNRDEHGVMTPLPRKCIDTGMGLERLAMLVQDVPTLFETDAMMGLINRIAELSGRPYEGEAPFRVIADHLRALMSAIADGAQPSNVERGYVLRKVLRRAVRYGRQLGFQEPFLAQICEMDPRTAEILTQEEESFFRTLKRGGGLLAQVVVRAQEEGGVISGDDAFKLKDTYGLPLEEILLLAKDDQLSVDLERYQALELEARERSKAVHKGAQQVVEVFEDLPPTRFVGYEMTECDAKVIAVRDGVVVLDQTPFYAEMGGQVGDTGTIEANGKIFEVEETKMLGAIAHIGKGALEVGDPVVARVDGERRKRIERNHTATHLLHWALRSSLGEGVQQRGSIVDAERLRFDFSHQKGLSQEEIRRVEDLVNAAIQENSPVQVDEMAYVDVQGRSDIVQFFGDKYGSEVRVVGAGVAKELCGGTHARATGEIGTFRIVSESSISAGVRRITAVTGPAAIEQGRRVEDLLEEVAALVKTQPAKLLERVSHLVEENTTYAAEMHAARKRRADELAAELADSVEEIGGMNLVSAEVEEGELRDLADAILRQLSSAVVVLGNRSGEKCSLLVRVSDDLVAKGIKAGALVKAAAPLMGGGGGGKPALAQAGGKEPAKLPNALAKVAELLGER